MQILYLPPDQDGYRLVEPTDRVLRARLAGGATRSRVDQAESWKQTTVTWTVGPSEYLMLTSFFETATQGGVNHFLCELITDSPVGKLHECHFLPGSRDLGNIQGHTYRFVGQLAVRPQRVDHELNRVRLKRYEENRFANLLNIEFKPVTAVQTSIYDGNYLVGQFYDLDLSQLFANPDCLDLRYEAMNIPDQLVLNPENGQLTGVLNPESIGERIIDVKVAHRLGETLNNFEINIRPEDAVGIAGHSLIPPMQIGSTFTVG